MGLAREGLKRARAERSGEGAAGECATAAERRGVRLVGIRWCAVLCSGLRAMEDSVSFLT